MNLLINHPFLVKRSILLFNKNFISIQFCTSLCKYQDSGRRSKRPDFLERVNRLYGWWQRPDYYRRDGMERDGHQLVYHAELDSYVKGTQLLVVASTWLTVSGAVYLGLCHWLGRSFTWSSGLLESHTEGVLTLLSLLVFNCAAVFVYLHVPYRIYHRPPTNDFVLLLCSPFNIFQPTRMVCQPGEMKFRSRPFWPSLTGRYCLGHRNLILQPHKFTSPSHYHALLGNKT